MKYLSRNDLETISGRVIAAYKKLPAISGQAPERVDIDYLCQELLGLRVDYIEDSTERFFKHETQMSSLIGGENEGYERFHEFIDYENTPENQAIEEMVFQSLRNVLDLLPPKDYELVYELYFKNRTERECAQRLGMSQQAVHERKKRILKKIKNNLDEEGC